MMPTDMRALQDFEEEDKLQINMNDVITIIEGRAEHYWWRGQNRRSLRVGPFPRHVVTSVAGLSAQHISRPLKHSFIHTGHGDTDPHRSWGHADRIDSLYLGNPMDPPDVLGMDPSKARPTKLPNRAKKPFYDSVMDNYDDEDDASAASGLKRLGVSLGLKLRPWEGPSLRSAKSEVSLIDFTDDSFSSTTPSPLTDPRQPDEDTLQDTPSILDWPLPLPAYDEVTTDLEDQSEDQEVRSINRGLADESFAPPISTVEGRSESQSADLFQELQREVMVKLQVPMAPGRSLPSSPLPLSRPAPHRQIYLPTPSSPPPASSSSYEDRPVLPPRTPLPPAPPLAPRPLQAPPSGALQLHLPRRRGGRRGRQPRLRLLPPADPAPGPPPRLLPARLPRLLPPPSPRRPPLLAAGPPAAPALHVAAAGVGAVLRGTPRLPPAHHPPPPLCPAPPALTPTTSSTSSSSIALSSTSFLDPLAGPEGRGLTSLIDGSQSSAPAPLPERPGYLERYGAANMAAVKPIMQQSRAKPNSSFNNNNGGGRTTAPSMQQEQSIKQVQEAVHGVTAEECQASLLDHGWSVSLAVQHLKVEQLFRLGLRSRSECVEVLEQSQWHLEEASTIILDTHTLQGSRYTHTHTHTEQHVHTHAIILNTHKLQSTRYTQTHTHTHTPLYWTHPLQSTRYTHTHTHHHTGHTHTLQSTRYTHTHTLTIILDTHSAEHQVHTHTHTHTIILDTPTAEHQVHTNTHTHTHTHSPLYWTHTVQSTRYTHTHTHTHTHSPLYWTHTHCRAPGTHTHTLDTLQSSRYTHTHTYTHTFILELLQYRSHAVIVCDCRPHLAAAAAASHKQRPTLKPTNKHDRRMSTARCVLFI
ncbi:Activated CDC42 kinase 1 [Merluccius polli]|uniref:non-specific protein-tyrosine kinase n=1 Tax=Merluccius polli TaxID=89951 RepID=A0AA47MNQ2_MERPO|nr:Activated CDC42 kinase 1 [Merluccius polli]